MRKLLATAALAALLALNVGGMPPAFADTIRHTVSPTGDHVYTTKDKEGNIKSIVVYDKNHKFLYSFHNDSTPGHDDQPGSTTGTQGIKDAIAQALQKGGGGSYLVRPDFYDTPFGKALVETGKTGSIIPYHNPADSLIQDFEGGYGGGKGGIDLNGGSIAEQIKKNGSKKKKDDDDDDDGNGGGNPGTGDDDLQFGGASADMELVNPVPVDRSAAKALKKKARQASPQDPNRGLPTALTRRSILDGGPSLLPAGPAAAGTPLVSGAGSPLGIVLK